jgi:hypothetical protein
VTGRDGVRVGVKASPVRRHVSRIATEELLPLRYFEPVDSLFALAIRKAERGALKEIVYHRQLGYPLKIVSGTPNPDDGLAIEVSELVPLP